VFIFHMIFHDLKRDLSVQLFTRLKLTLSKTFFTKLELYSVIKNVSKCGDFNFNTKIFDKIEREEKFSRTIR